MYIVYYTICGFNNQRRFNSWKQAIAFALRKEHSDASITDGARVWMNITLSTLVPAKYVNITRKDVEDWRYDPKSVHPNMAAVIEQEMQLSSH